ncbi:MAG: TlpA disulfide reductase family protein [Pseudomonadota bacterium]
MRPLPTICIILALAACQQAPKQDQPAANQAAAQPGPVKGVDRSHKGAPAPGTAFTNPEGGQAHLADFKGKPLLVNLWASWCAPCVKELPTLDKLATGKTVQVLAVSQDSGPHSSVIAFMGAHKIGFLDPYQDPKMALSAALGPETVLPTSILYDAEGREVWRYVGDLDWTSPQAARLLSEACATAPAG